MIEEKEIMSNEPYEDIINELSLFKQTEFCINYIKANISSIEEEQANQNAVIASAAFRQAEEYVNAGKSVSLITRPLLFSYALNNYTKGMVYLLTQDQEVLNKFQNHGFNKLKLEESILDVSLNIKNCGAITALESIVQDTITPSNSVIKIDTLLSLIPKLSKIYFQTTNKYSMIGYEYSDYGFKINSNTDINKELSDKIREEWSIISKYNERNKEINILLSIAARQKIYNSKGLFIISNKTIALPIIIGEKLHSIQPMVAAYIIMMSYSMIVRYNADKWDKYINPKESKEYTLIDISVKECLEEFIVGLHRKLFKYRIVRRNYTDDDVKRLIQSREMRRDITDIVNEELGKML